MLDKNFSELPLKERLDAQIEELKEIAKLYNDLVYNKKQYDYEYRMEAVGCQLQALFDLRNSDFNDINDWSECYKEDIVEYNSKNK